jgi:molybdate transport system permease protein
VATWATLACLVLGGRGLCAGALALPGRDLLDTLLTLPMVMPTVLGYYLLVLLGRKGPVGGWLHDTFGINLIFTWQAR